MIDIKYYLHCSTSSFLNTVNWLRDKILDNNNLATKKKLRIVLYNVWLYANYPLLTDRTWSKDAQVSQIQIQSYSNYPRSTTVRVLYGNENHCFTKYSLTHILIHFHSLFHSSPLGFNTKLVIKTFRWWYSWLHFKYLALLEINTDWMNVIR